MRHLGMGMRHLISIIFCIFAAWLRDWSHAGMLFGIPVHHTGKPLMFPGMIFVLMIQWARWRSLSHYREKLLIFAINSQTDIQDKIFTLIIYNKKCMKKKQLHKSNWLVTMLLLVMSILMPYGGGMGTNAFQTFHW